MTTIKATSIPASRADSQAIFGVAQDDAKLIENTVLSPQKTVDTLVRREAEKPDISMEQRNAHKNSWGLEAWMPWNWFAPIESDISILDDDGLQAHKYCNQDAQRLMDHWQEIAEQSNDQFKNDLTSVFRLMMHVMSKQRELQERSVELSVEESRGLRNEKRQLESMWIQFRQKYDERIEGKYWIDRIQEGLQLAGLIGSGAVAMGSNNVSPVGALRLLVAGSVLIDDMLGGHVQKGTASIIARASAWVAGCPTNKRDEESWQRYVSMAAHLLGPLSSLVGSTTQTTDQLQRSVGAAVAWTQAGTQLVSAHTDYQLNHARAEEQLNSAQRTVLGERSERLMSSLSQSSNSANAILRDQSRSAEQQYEVMRQMFYGV